MEMALAQRIKCKLNHNRHESVHPHTITILHISFGKFQPFDCCTFHFMLTVQISRAPLTMIKSDEVEERRRFDREFVVE